jgi:hypothetical protein
MKVGDTLTRKDDGKPFKVVYVAHWSEIISEDGEAYSVKWYGGGDGVEFYVGVNGPSFERRTG